MNGRVREGYDRRSRRIRTKRTRLILPFHRRSCWNNDHWVFSKNWHTFWGTFINHLTREKRAKKLKPVTHVTMCQYDIAPTKHESPNTQLGSSSMVGREF